MNKKQLEKDVLLVRKLKPTFFEYYKQGFLFSNFILSGSLLTTKNELQNFILEDFKDFFDRNLEEHYLNLQDDNLPKQSAELNLSDIIRNGEKSKDSFQPEFDKRLTTCPLCSKEIYANDINLDQIDLSKINNFPFDYIHIHSHKDYPPHALLMYFDAHFKVRGRKVPKFTNLAP